MTADRKPEYPGDYVQITQFVKDGELGDVRIQWLGPDRYKVCSFLPGETESSPGDTPKTWPERWCTSNSREIAEVWYQQFMHQAIKEGWTHA